MILNALRSSVFNTLFFIITLAGCILYTPLILLSHRLFIKTVIFYLRIVHILEVVILGLNYEVRGKNNLPKKGAFIVAAKHYSTYETFKLHLILDDPAIILKRELLKIPLWGWYLKKSNPIAINRQNAKAALFSMIEGAKKIEAAGRPLVIFPQGTRVKIEDTPQNKPYKSGVARIHDNTNMPVIPMATNSGYFSPRKSWIKKPGKVVFEFLPALPDNLKDKELMARLEETLEEASSKLIKEAKS